MHVTMSRVNFAARFRDVVIAKLGSHGILLSPAPSDEKLQHFVLGSELDLHHVSQTSNEWLNGLADTFVNSIVTALRAYECQHAVSIDVTWKETTREPNIAFIQMDVMLRPGERTGAIVKALQLVDSVHSAIEH